MIPDAWRLYKDVGTAIAKAVMANPTQKAKFISCDPATAGCLTTTIQSFGRKAFRRPLTTAEVARFEALGQGASIGTPNDVAEATLLGFLLSPSFLMVPEMTTTPGSSAPSIQLSSHEVAARLSFLIWGSVPDDVLNTAADGNQLQTKDQILSQAQRMIAMRDKAASQVSAFHRYWAGMDNASGHWWNGEHDVTKFPLYSPAAKTTYSAELDNFFAEIAFTNGSYKDLLLSNVGFVNKDNAAIYGLSNSGTALTRVELDSMQRPGFLTRAGFLSSYAHYDTTAPILRGAYINLNLIGINPGPPVPGAFTLMPPTGVYSTNRERTEALTSQSASCAGCHANILNPPGFVLENYDAIGAWQTVDKLGNGAINPVATVNFGDGIIKEIHNAQELMQQLAQTRKGRAMYAQSLVSYGYGRDPNVERSVRRRPDQRQAGRGWRHPRCARRSHPGGFLPLAGPCTMTTRRGIGMKRRVFLRGLGGAAVAAPFLSSVWERETKGQTATTPKQLIVMFTHYGCITTKWFPVKSHGALAASDLTSTSLAALAPYVGKLLIPRGIRAMNEWTVNNKDGEGADRGTTPTCRWSGRTSPCSRSRPTPRPVQLRLGDEVQCQAGRQLAGSRHGAAAQPVRDASLHAGWQQSDSAQSAYLLL